MPRSDEPHMSSWIIVYADFASSFQTATRLKVKPPASAAFVQATGGAPPIAPPPLVPPLPCVPPAPAFLSPPPPALQAAEIAAAPSAARANRLKSWERSFVMPGG